MKTLQNQCNDSSDKLQAEQESRRLEERRRKDCEEREVTTRIFFKCPPHTVAEADSGATGVRAANKARTRNRAQSPSPAIWGLNPCFSSDSSSHIVCRRVWKGSCRVGQRVCKRPRAKWWRPESTPSNSKLPFVIWRAKFDPSRTGSRARLSSSNRLLQPIPRFQHNIRPGPNCSTRRVAFEF